MEAELVTKNPERQDERTKQNKICFIPCRHFIEEENGDNGEEGIEDEFGSEPS